MKIYDVWHKHLQGWSTTAGEIVQAKNKREAMKKSSTYKKVKDNKLGIGLIRVNRIGG